MNPSPLHEGEVQVQKRLGVHDQVTSWARQVIRTQMPDQHRDFFAQLPFMVAAAYDQQQRPWVTLLTGSPGFVDSPSATRLNINANPFQGDAIEHGFNEGLDIGLLGIELSTRRRNRVNGKVIRQGNGAIEFAVRQSFGNCPQYINPRDWRTVETINRPSAVRATQLSPEMMEWISNADTFFIASGAQTGGAESSGLDASHRGGSSGFVEVLNNQQLLFPDYSGNNLFNTIGNLVLDPRVGLLFIDFATGSLLQITGVAQIDWDSPEVGKRPGAQRLIAIDIEAIVLQESVLPIRWHSARDKLCPLRIENKIHESKSITSFILKPEDQQSCDDFSAGQYLPLHVQTQGQTFVRNYSISNRPGEGVYRISVKRHRQGVVSQLLHDSLKIGNVLEAEQPAGGFVVEADTKPIVLIGGGVGVTPLISMLHQLLVSHFQHNIYFFHGVRNGEEHPFANEIRQLVQQSTRLKAYFAYSQPTRADKDASNYTINGRLRAEAVIAQLPTLDMDFYLCGSPSFTAQVGDGLLAAGVPAKQLKIEAF